MQSQELYIIQQKIQKCLNLHSLSKEIGDKKTQKETEKEFIELTAERDAIKTK